MNNKKDVLGRILNRIPKDIFGLKLYILKNKKEEKYVLVGAGPKFEDEITMPLSKAEFEFVVDFFPVSTTYITGTCTVQQLSIIYRKLALDEIIETL